MLSPQVAATGLLLMLLAAYMAAIVELLDIMAGIMDATELGLLFSTLGALMIPNMPFSLKVEQSMNTHKSHKLKDIPVSRGTTVVEERVGVVHGLGEGETKVALACSESSTVRGLVARGQFAGLRDGVVVRSPYPVEGVTDGCVDGERNHPEDTLGGSDVDGVRRAGTCLRRSARSVGSRCGHGSHGSVGSNTFCTSDQLY